MARVMLVDDDQSILHLFTRVLEGDGYHVESAENVNDAMAALSSRNFDVVVTDIHMPGLQGTDLLREIKHRRRTGSRRTGSDHKK